jgi:type II secretory pathway component PulC
LGPILKRVKTLLPYLLVTLLCVGGVELFYGAFKKKLLIEPKRAASSSITEQGAQTGEQGSYEKFDYQVIVDRNLFGSSEGDAPVDEKDKPENGDLEATSLEIVLLGTISGETKGQRAFIVDKTTNKQDIYMKGDGLQGAIIKDIQRGKIILHYQGKDEVLHMSTDDDGGQQGGVAVNPSPRKKRMLPAPPSGRLGGNSRDNVRTATPKRRFSFKKAVKPTLEPEEEPELDSGVDQGSESSQ